jgi:hypothetical protein
LQKSAKGSKKTSKMEASSDKDLYIYPPKALAPQKVWIGKGISIDKKLRNDFSVSMVSREYALRALQKKLDNPSLERTDLVINNDNTKKTKQKTK